MRTLSRAAGVAIVVALIACGGDDVTPAVPVASVRFVVGPSDLVAGTTLSLDVELLGADGSRAHGARDQVALSVSDGSSFTGPFSVAASNGLAHFRNISLTHAGTGLYLKAAVGDRTATTDAFTVTHAAASGARSSVASAASIIPPAEPTPVTFTFADAFGNPISASVTLSASTGVTFTPSSGTSAADGKFATKINSSVGGAVTLAATVGGQVVTLASPLVVCPNPALAIPATSSGALSTSSCIVSGRPTAYHRFTQSAAGGAAFAITSAFSPRLEVRTDAAEDNVYSTPFQFLPTEWLLAAGSYELRVSAVTGAGSYSITSSATAGNSGCIRRNLAAPGTFTGQALATGDCDYGDGTRVDKYLVYSPRPCSFRLHSTTFTNFIFLVDPATGGFLDGRGGGEIGEDALFGLPACSLSGGPIEVWMLPDEHETGGAYTMTYTLFALPSQVASLSAPNARAKAIERARAAFRELRFER